MNSLFDTALQEILQVPAMGRPDWSAMGVGNHGGVPKNRGMGALCAGKSERTGAIPILGNHRITGGSG